MQIIPEWGETSATVHHRGGTDGRGVDLGHFTS